MKLAINKCYGGFSLSVRGLKEYAKLKGYKLHFYDLDYTDGLYKKVTKNFSTTFAPFAFTKDLGKSLTSEEINEVWNDCYFESRPEERNDPDLIKVVETLGKKAGGDCADIQIIEIPNGVDYEIEEYDGIEWVAEKHRTWS